MDDRSSFYLDSGRRVAVVRKLYGAAKAKCEGSKVLKNQSWRGEIPSVAKASV
jgi:hypothetical protein